MQSRAIVKVGGDYGIVVEETKKCRRRGTF